MRIKTCKQCGEELVRRVHPGGSMEPKVTFSKREYCSLQCCGLKAKEDCDSEAIETKNCDHCGSAMTRTRWPSGAIEPKARFDKKKYCSRKCMGLGKKGNPSTYCKSASHKLANELKPKGLCEECRTEGGLSEVHHVDGDWRNNALSNLQRLCRPCHDAKHTSPPCRVCGKKHMAKGLCSKCYKKKQYLEKKAEAIAINKFCDWFNAP